MADNQKPDDLTTYEAEGALMTEIIALTYAIDTFVKPKADN
jgi:hypothetical protein